jgi:outer membrane murein-binding lipoprotein Lpp
MVEKSADAPPSSPFSRRALPRRRRWNGYRVAAALSIGWAFCVFAYAVGFLGLFGSVLLAPRTTAALEIALFILAAALPAALFFYGALLARKSDEIRTEAARLSSAIDALRVTVAPRSMPGAEEMAEALTSAARTTMSEERAALGSAIDQLSRALAETRGMVEEMSGRDSKARRAGKKTATPPALSDKAQPALPFDAAEEANTTSVPWDSVVRALQFPRDADDAGGFDALRAVVADHDLAALLQAAEDTLSILSEDGLFMEDVQPEIAPLADWRRYAEGARGTKVSTIGGIGDDVALAIARGRLRNDPVFRDTAMHFLRRFDKLVARMLDELGDDPMVLEAADSRTGRAFMIVARAMGVFD